MKKFNAIYTLAYCFTISLGAVFIESSKPLSVEVSLWITTLLAILFFNSINYKSIIEFHKKLWQQKRLFLLINVLIFLAWLFTYLGIYNIGPTYFNFISFMSLGFLLACIERNFLKIIVVLACIVLSISNYEGHLLGLLFGALTGGCLYLYNLISKKLTDVADVSATQLLAGRFYLMLIALLPFLPHGALSIPSIHDMALLGIIALCTFIAPIYFFQKGLMVLDIKYHSMLLTLVPLITYFLDGVINATWSWNMLILSAIVPFVLNENIYKKLKRKKPI